MKKTTLIVISLQLSIFSLFGQNITGKWYEIYGSNSDLDITIENNNEGYSGTFNWKFKNWINTVNAPLDQITVKNDSLLFELTNGNFKLHFKFLKDNETDTYKGFVYNNGRQMEPVTLSRTPIERDLTPRAIVEKTPTRQDSLRGSITPERAWWDLRYYHLDIKLDVENKSINGSNIIQYKVLEPQSVLQIDLQSPMKISKVVQKGKALQFTTEGSAHFIELEENQKVGDINQIQVFYEGIPRDAPRAPWDGGFSWKKDKKGKHFIATSNQGDGASLWWPNKDHMYDEVDSMLISVNIPKGLTNISNGRLRKLEEHGDGTITSHWFVNNPINNYGVNINIGDYVHFAEVYEGENGPLDLDYYVLSYNLDKAKEQFKQAPKMMKAFEHWFGPYPFYKDGYKLVEAPYLGMEHQSSVTYGNGYENGYLGRDLSQSGWGLKFDYIIIHESGHEWFANNITYKDMADMWIHESFTCYSESIYLEYYFGKEAATEYLMGLRRHGISNDKPIIGDYDINDEDHTGDIYPKGAIMLHTLRQVINDDKKWRSILRGMNKQFYHQTVTTKDIEDYIAIQAGINLEPFFDQYLRTIQIPTLEYYFTKEKFGYRWVNAVPAFDMPIKIFVDEKEKWIYPKTNWTEDFMQLENAEVIIDSNFYVGEMTSAGKNE
jgi:aminopeptidase N